MELDNVEMGMNGNEIAGNEMDSNNKKAKEFKIKEMRKGKGNGMIGRETN